MQNDHQLLCAMYNKIASAMCYVLKNGLCYVLCKTPWGAPSIKALIMSSLIYLVLQGGGGGGGYFYELLMALYF